MPGILEIGVVIAIVGAAAWHAVRTFMPRALRKQAAGATALQGKPEAASCNTGCGTCGGCDSANTNVKRSIDR
jgi:hypothetical protein